MNRDSQHIDALITRFLTGEATPDQVRELQQWMDASAENRKYFDGISFVHRQAEASRPVIAFDTDKAWDKLHVKMHQSTQPEKPVAKVIPMYRTIGIKIAASLIILISLTSVIIWSVTRVVRVSFTQIETNNEIQKTVLADQSKIILNKKSKITYAKGFGKTNRQITLEGEAFFDVKHDSVHPFVVKTDGAFVKDIGTSFNLKSYGDSTFIEVYVESGVVMFYSDNNPGITLLPGEVGVYDKKTQTFRKLKSVEPSVTSYTNRSFVFERNTLQNVVDQLNQMYVEQIVLADRELGSMEITVTFDNESLENIARIIAETLDLKVRKQDNTWVILNK